MSPLAACLPAFLLASLPAGGTELKPATLEDFDRYVREAESAMDKTVRGDGFLWAAGQPERLKQVRDGQMAIQPCTGKGEVKVRDGLVHDWIGTVFVPGAGVGRVLKMIQDYDNHKNVYKPEVMDSKLLSQNGNDFRIFLRLLKKKVLTVILDTDHDVRYTQVDAHRWYSRSRTSRIAEVQDYGKPGQRTLPPGEDHGFLWRLYTYWRFAEQDGGTFVECRAISLTRDVPTGFGWLITPIIRNLPRESVERTLRGTHDALR